MRHSTLEKAKVSAKSRKPRELELILAFFGHRHFVMKIGKHVYKTWSINRPPCPTTKKSTKIVIYDDSNIAPKRGPSTYLLLGSNSIACPQIAFMAAGKATQFKYDSYDYDSRDNMIRRTDPIGAVTLEDMSIAFDSFGVAFLHSDQF